MPVLTQRNSCTEDSEASEVVKISTGQLYLIRAGTIRSDRECMYANHFLFPFTGFTDPLFVAPSYNDAMATIRRVPSIEHHFQLVITRVYEEGDEELFEGEEESASSSSALTRNPNRY